MIAVRHRGRLIIDGRASLRRSGGCPNDARVARDGTVVEVDPPDELGRGEVVVLQPYGPIFFASASVLVDQMPEVTAATQRSVVILRIRGADDPGVTFIETIARYAAGLAVADSRLVLVTDNERLVRQLRETGAMSTIGDENVYLGTEVVGATTRRAHADALEWIAARNGTDGGAA